MTAKLGTVIGTGAGAAVIAALLYFALAPVKDAEIADSSHREAEKTDGRIAVVSPDLAERGATQKPSATSPRTARREGRPPKMEQTKDWYESLSSAKDRAMGKRIQDALDNNDLEETRKAAKEAQASSSVEVRQTAVDALAWFGTQAITELTPFLVDRDEEVARAAFNAWDTSIDMMENDANRVKLVGMAMEVLTDKDSLMSAAAKIEASEDRKAAVDAIISVVESGNKPAAEAAKEAYSFIMGEPYENATSARGKVLLMKFGEEHDN